MSNQAHNCFFLAADNYDDCKMLKIKNLLIADDMCHYYGFTYHPDFKYSIISFSSTVMVFKIPFPYGNDC